MMKNDVNIVMDGIRLSVPSETTILEAAGIAGVEIPTLCHHEALPPDGNCRLCMVEVFRPKRRGQLVISCMYPIRGPLQIKTKSDEVIGARRFIIGLLLSRAPKSRTIHALAEEYSVEIDPRFLFDPDECARCDRCVRACETLGLSAIGQAWRGFGKKITPPFMEPPKDCIGCAACADVCPTDYIQCVDEDDTRTIWNRNFTLIRCPICGEAHTTEEALEYLGLEDLDARLCPRCRKREYAAKFKIFVP